MTNKNILQVNSLEITSPENKMTLLVSGLSFEVKSGEILAVLATSQQEATGLLNVLAGVRKVIQSIYNSFKSLGM